MSVPCVITIRVLRHRPAALQNQCRGPPSVICRLSIIISVSISTSQQAAPQPQHVAGVRALKEQFAGQFVVFLVERAAGDQDADRFHSRASASIARYIGVIPMRGMRWLLLVAIAAILGGVVYQYRAQKEILARNAPPTPAAALPRT